MAMGLLYSINENNPEMPGGPRDGNNLGATPGGDGRGSAEIMGVLQAFSVEFND
jgi:hypothetical protein